MGGQLLVRPAAAEVRAMLHKIKKDNMERGRKISATTGLMMNPACHPPSPILCSNSGQTSYNFRPQMGSFTSMPKIRPAPNAEDQDVDFGSNRVSLEAFLKRCRDELGNLPAVIPRQSRQRTTSLSKDGNEGFYISNAFALMNTEKIRVFQWNALSQALGTGNDNFVKCPSQALEWPTRRFRMIEEIAQHNADVICLQEIDHFNFFRKALATLGYVGHFTPKPDSPCLYLADNSGPDGCAIFYKKDKFDLVTLDSRVLEVWNVQSNQVVLSATLKSKKTGQEVVFATTHLKARNGALMPTLRNEQGKDLMEYLNVQAQGLPTVVTGDFNAEPNEPVYQTMTNNKSTKLASAYNEILNKEPEYTTWKYREDGEHIQTLDYIFYSPDQIRVDAVLEMPTGEQIGENRLPSLSYASDHFSLVTDLRLMAGKRI